MAREKKHHWFRRLLAMLGCLVLLGAALAWLIVGFHVYVIVVLLSGAGLVAGPAVSEGGSFLDIVSSIFEIIAEGIAAIFEAIESFFSGLG